MTPIPEAHGAQVKALIAKAIKSAAEHYGDSPSQSWWREMNGAFVNHYFCLTESPGGWFVRRHHGATLNQKWPLPSLLVAQCFADEVLKLDAHHLFADVWNALENVRDDEALTGDLRAKFDAALVAAELSVR